MIWHIFKKDWKLLWPMVAGVALIYFVHRIGLYELGHFNSKPTLLPLMNLLLYAEYIAPLFLVAFVVQQDAVPGVRQDWLVRPIKRRDLILAKILFVLLLVQGPMIAADAFEGLINGFSFGQSWGAAFSRGLWLFPFFFVAAIAFAALTPTLMEAIAAGVIIFLGGAVFGLTTATFVFHGRPQFWVEWSGLSWINLTEKTAVSLLCAIAILALIYFRRKILPARWIFGAGALCWMLTSFTPWTPHLQFKNGRLRSQALLIPLRSLSLPAWASTIRSQFRMRKIRDAASTKQLRHSLYRCAFPVLHAIPC